MERFHPCEVSSALPNQRVDRGCEYKLPFGSDMAHQKNVVSLAKSMVFVRDNLYFSWV